MKQFHTPNGEHCITASKMNELVEIRMPLKVQDEVVQSL